MLQGKNGRLLPKTIKNELLALKVWGKCKNCKRIENTMAGFEHAMQWLGQ
jgi:hypothetical protein